MPYYKTLRVTGELGGKSFETELIEAELLTDGEGTLQLGQMKARFKYDTKKNLLVIYTTDDEGKPSPADLSSPEGEGLCLRDLINDFAWREVVIGARKPMEDLKKTYTVLWLLGDNRMACLEWHPEPPQVTDLYSLIS